MEPAAGRRCRLGQRGRGPLRPAGRGLRHRREHDDDGEPLRAADAERPALGLGPGRLGHRRHDDRAGGERRPVGTGEPGRPLDAPCRRGRAGRADGGGRDRRHRPRAQGGRVLGRDRGRGGLERGRHDGGCEPGAAGAGGQPDVRPRRRHPHAGRGARASPRRRRRGDRDRRRARRARRLRGPGDGPRRRGAGAHARRARGLGLPRVGRLGRGAAQPRRAGPRPLVQPEPHLGRGVERRGAAVVGARRAGPFPGGRDRGRTAPRGRAGLRSRPARRPVHGHAEPRLRALGHVRASTASAGG